MVAQYDGRRCRWLGRGAAWDLGEACRCRGGTERRSEKAANGACATEKKEDNRELVGARRSG
jgi:hypothetical protein